MIIDEAIKVNTALRTLHANGLMEIEEEAIQLGIEALKRHKEMSALVPAMPYPLLPGETPKIDTKRSLHHIKETLQGIGKHP